MAAPCGLLARSSSGPRVGLQAGPHALAWAASASGLLGRPSSTEAEPAAHKLHAPVRALESGHEQALAPPPTAAEPARCRSPREARTAASTLASHRRSRAVALALALGLLARQLLSLSKSRGKKGRAKNNAEN